MNAAAQGFRLSPQQQRLWSLAQQGSPIHPAQAALRLRGDLRPEALTDVLRSLVLRHEILRTVFRRPPGLRLPVQVIDEPWRPELQRTDLRSLSPSERDARVEQLWCAASLRSAELETMPPLTATLLELAPEDHLLMVAMNPLCADERTLDVLVAELGAAYAAACDGGAGRDPAFPYARFADWQNALLAEEGDDELREFWQERSTAALRALALPCQLSPTLPPRQRDPEAVPVPLELSAGGLHRLEETSARCGASVSAFLLACWHALLGRLTGEEELVVADLDDGRSEAVLSEAFGLFAKWLPVRMRWQGDLRFAELLADVGAEKTSVQEFADGFLWGETQELKRGQARPIPVGFELSSWPEPTGAAGVTFSLARRRACVDDVQLRLSAIAGREGLRLEILADGDRFEGDDVRRLAAQLAALIHEALDRTDALLAELELLSEAERRQVIVECNQTGRELSGESLLQRFERVAAERPGQIAVRVEEQALGYGELNARANRLAWRLREMGVAPDIPVALGLGRSVEMLVGILGVLKAGGAYVPLDLEQPARRLAHVVEETTVLVTERPLLELLPPITAKVLCLEELAAGSFRLDDPPPVVSGENLAYVIFTSGSTGRPKGVAVEHRQLRNYVEGVLERLALPTAASFAMVSTFAADLGHTMLFPALVTGGCLHVVSQARAADPQSLAEYFGQHRIDCLKIVPSHLSTLLDTSDRLAVLPRQRLVLGGEALPWTLLATIQELAPECRVFNHYGPSETTVGVSTFAATGLVREPRCATVPIGQPISNTEIYLLDSRFRPVPHWVPGELCIGGANVSRGYLGQPDLTAASFIPDPWSGRPGARLYRSGDLARRLPGGNIEFLGRWDHQIKLHGYRIELAEIRSALCEHPLIRDSIVVLARDEDGGDALVAYYVSRQELETGELREFLRPRILAAAIPGFFVRLKRLPLTLNGKVHHAALPPLAEIKKQVQRSAVPPRTAIEEIVAGMWTEQLGMPRVSSNDSFFELGGHSLLATRLISRVRRTFRIDLSLGSLFESPTVAGLSARIESALRAGAETAAPPITRMPRQGELPLSFAQERLWFMHQLEPDNPAYNVPAALRVSGPLRVAELARSLGEEVRRHEVLRTVFPSDGGRPLQTISADAGPRLWMVDLTGLEEARREEEARRLATSEAAQPFDLARGPLLRAGLVRLGELEHLALFTLHHIVSDAWSMDVLVREVTALYNAFTAGQPSPLPDLPIQYVDFAFWQRQWLADEVLEAHLSSWKKRLAGAPEVTILPGDRPRPAARSLRGGILYRELPASLVSPLRELSRREGATLFMTLVTAFYALLNRATGREDLVVGTDVANRNRLETEGLIGFFINNLALRATLSGNPSFRELLQQVREASLEAYAHQDLPFDQIVKALKVKRSLSHTPVFQILIVHQNAPASGLKLHGLRIVREPHSLRTSKFDLALFLREQADGLLGEWTYSTDLFDAATIERLAYQLHGLLDSALAHPGAAIGKLEMASAIERKQQEMRENERQETSLSRLRGFRRRAVEDDASSMVRCEHLAPEQTLPLILRPEADELDLSEWAAHNREFLEEKLLRHGALLFRGFDVHSVQGFERFAQAITPDLFAEYGDLPSEEGSQKVYRSTPYPASKTILFHNESSHMHRWPQRQWFFCVTAAQQGGETPIVDCREIYRRLDPEVREGFEQKSLLYVRNFIRGFDVSWQDFFRTESRSEVERYCREAGIDYEWDGDDLRTRQTCPAVIRHPRTDELIFFNQIMLHHVSCLEPEVRESMFALFDETSLPRNVYYGDGTPIPDATVRGVYDLYWQTAVSFPWQEGDILMVDNALVAHARNPFVGPRKIVVAMGDLFSNRDLRA